MPNVRKPIDKKKTLAAARKKGRLEAFIKAHEKDEPGDLDRLEDAIRKPSSPGSASAIPKASRPASSDD